MVVTGDDVISEALILLGVKYAGQSISAEAKATSLLGLNLLIGEWNATGQAVYSVGRLTFPLIAGSVSYTIGPSGANFTATRPEKIETWAVTTAGGTADEGVPLSSLAFEQANEDSTAIGTRIRALTYDAGFPNGTIRIYPIPFGGQTLALWVWNQLAEVTDTTVALAFPTGYYKAIIYNLAVDLAPKFGRPMPPTDPIKMVADQCKASLGATNASEHTPAAA